MADKRVRYYIDAKDETKAAITSAKRRVKSFAKDISGVSLKLSGLAGIASVAGISALAKDSIEFSDNLAKTANKIGLNTDNLQEMRFVGARAGLSIKEVDTSLQRFSRRVAEASNGTGVLKKELDNLGVNIFDSSGNLRPVIDILDDYSDAIANAKSEQEKLRLTFVGMDTEGAKFVVALKQGSNALREGRRQAHEYGTVINGELLKGAEEAADEFGILSEKLSKELYEAILKNKEGISDFITFISEATSALGNLFSIIDKAAEINAKTIAAPIKFIADSIRGDSEQKKLSNFQIKRNKLQKEYNALLKAGVPDYILSDREKRIEELTEKIDKILAPPARPTATSAPPARPTATSAPPARPTATSAPPARPTATSAPPARPTATSAPPARPTATTEAFSTYIRNLNEELVLSEEITRVQRAKIDFSSEEYSTLTESQKEVILNLSSIVDKKEEERRLDNLAFDLNPYNQLSSELSDIDKLFDSGRISAETYFDAISSGMNSLDTEELSSKTDELRNDIEDAIGSGLYSALDGDFRGIALSFSSMLQQMAVEAASKKIADILLGGSGGSGGSGIIQTILPFLFHGGGIIGTNTGRSKPVNPLAFSDAPRMHTGGIIGNEVPIVGLKGEEVLTQDDPRHISNISGSSQNINVAIVDGRRSLQEYLSSEEAGKVIVKHIGANKNSVSLLLR